MSNLNRSGGDIARLLQQQREAFLAEGPVSEQTRIDRIQRVINLLVKYHQQLAAAMGADFGHRHTGISLANDILGSLACLKHVREKLGEWMKPEKRQPPPPYDQLGAEAWVMYQPKGTVGIIGTWNAPVFTLLSPLADALGAGNRAILKPSEIAPRTAEILAGAFAEMIDPLEVAVVLGGADVAQTFTASPFDHIVFTGSTAVAKSVMRNASDNLVPVTLELGGKSPTVISRSADLDTAAFRIAAGKSANGGQFCVNPDITYVPRERLEDFVAAMRSAYESIFPSVAGNPDVTAAINPNHLKRVESYVEDAVRSGARVEVLSEAVPVDMDDRRRPLRLVIAPGKDTRIMQEEIFGSAMVIQPYDQLDDVIADINSRERPLALYYFGKDEAEQNRLLDHTLSGGVTINEVMMHPAMLDAPFGGIGASGMGHYHGREGFLEFSHARTVFKAGDYDPRKEWGLLPPYGEQFAAAMAAQVTP